MELTGLSGKHFIVEDNPFAHGGEGQVHRILQPVLDADKCVKIYYRGKRSKEREERLRFMIANQPKDWRGDTYTVCWPLDIVSMNGEIVGFVMPMAKEETLSLYVLCLPEILGVRHADLWNNKFDRSNSEGFLARHKLCANIAVAIYKVYSAGFYVLGDLKPQNILATITGKIYLIDTDSIQISTNQKLLFKATALTPDYAPPELKSSPLETTWDMFSLAIVFYQVLLGVHPFSSIPVDDLGEFDSLHTNITHGLFPFGSNQKKIKTTASLHKSYKNLGSDTQKLFFKTFEDGLSKPDLRTTAEEWWKTFFYEVRRLEGLAQRNPPPTKPVVSKRTPPTPVVPRYVPAKSTKSIDFVDIMSWLLILLTILMFVFVFTSSDTQEKILNYFFNIKG